MNIQSITIGDEEYSDLSVVKEGVYSNGLPALTLLSPELGLVKGVTVNLQPYGARTKWGCIWVDVNGDENFANTLAELGIIELTGETFSPPGSYITYPEALMLAPLLSVVSP